MSMKNKEFSFGGNNNDMTEIVNQKGSESNLKPSEKLSRISVEHFEDDKISRSPRSNDKMSLAVEVIPKKR